MVRLLPFTSIQICNLLIILSFDFIYSDEIIGVWEKYDVNELSFMMAGLRVKTDDFASAKHNFAVFDKTLHEAQNISGWCRHIHATQQK